MSHKNNDWWTKLALCEFVVSKSSPHRAVGRLQGKVNSLNCLLKSINEFIFHSSSHPRWAWYLLFSFGPRTQWHNKLAINNFPSSNIGFFMFVRTLNLSMGKWFFFLSTHPPPEKRCEEKGERANNTQQHIITHFQHGRKVRLTNRQRLMLFDFY